ncbi:hypothetical protein [Actibacterium sp. 188UL27-1]|uniref:hypothetical protein n=1 Tax=Actibacterium sp. 188UL27-1 TaxID=2786961 RepID=UPI00195BFDEF|nr:hypothetical protein [Actibacterium sp. 188UL27-1]MBM7069308.1 hypothetical protein [Actibacterium sp. 188UL27-1]
MMAWLGAAPIVALALPSITEERGLSAPKRKFARCGGLSLYVAAYLERHAATDRAGRAKALRAAASYQSGVAANLPGSADRDTRVTARLRAAEMVSAALTDYIRYRPIETKGAVPPWREPGTLKADYEVCHALSKN